MDFVWFHFLLLCFEIFVCFTVLCTSNHCLMIVHNCSTNEKNHFMINSHIYDLCTSGHLATISLSWSQLWLPDKGLPTCRIDSNMYNLIHHSIPFWDKQCYEKDIKEINTQIERKGNIAKYTLHQHNWSTMRISQQSFLSICTQVPSYILKSAKDWGSWEWIHLLS